MKIAGAREFPPPSKLWVHSTDFHVRGNLHGLTDIYMWYWTRQPKRLFFGVTLGNLGFVVKCIFNRPLLRTLPPPHSHRNQRLKRQFDGLLMIGIVMPETCWAVSVRQNNKILRLIVASSWVVLFELRLGVTRIGSRLGYQESSHISIGFPKSLRVKAWIASAITTSLFHTDPTSFCVIIQAFVGM